MTSEQEATVREWTARIGYAEKVSSVMFRPGFVASVGVRQVPYAWGFPWHKYRTRPSVWDMPAEQLARLVGAVR